MGFFNQLGNAFMGKPLGSSSPQNQPASTTGSNGIIDERGLKIIPDIDVKNLRSQRQGGKLIVKAWIANNSDQELRIDTTLLLKQKRTQNQLLGPRHSHELTLYDGQVPDNENEHTAQIVYRLQVNGDVFMENYRINYDLESDGKRTIGGLIDDGPVRDI